MREPTVADVMTRATVTAAPDTTFSEIVSALIDTGASALPVIDPAGRLIGVVDEADVLAKLEFRCGTDARPLLAGAQTRARWRKSSATTAADLMTAPATTIGAEAPLSAAMRSLACAQLRQLCVVDHTDLLVGVLARPDALRLFLRSDAAIKADIEELAVGARYGADDVTVQVSAGIVTLDGTLALRSTVEHAGRTACGVPGVVAIHNNLRFEFDDQMCT
ncbi:CBS domain-containing protein [Amycolatopsis sp. NPDC057786]|uniref:CBS domain-containing protein n=1 Tax=Amycolatopsis sp. NPDC057786 TaxID=3346250 RepID=UPI00367199D6